MEAHIDDIARVIQLAVAPVFLLTGVGTLITALNNRLGRIVDRRRVLLNRVPEPAAQVPNEARAEIDILAQRVRIVYLAILAAVTAALLVCLVVASSFVGALLVMDLSRVVAVLFILAMCALIACLSLFLREVFLAVTHRTHIQR